MAGPYTTQLAMLESTGGQRMYNGLGSGATGKYQFMPATWADLLRRFPNAGLTPEGITDNTPGGQQDMALQLFNQSNNAVLKRTLGRDPQAWETYAAHRFGAGGAQDLLGAPDDTPARLMFPAKWIEQNPDIANKTAGEIKTLFQGRFGQTPPIEVAARPPAQPVQETPAMQQSAPAVPGLLSDPAQAAPQQPAAGGFGEGGWQSALVAGLLSLGDGIRGGSGTAGMTWLTNQQQQKLARQDRADDRRYKEAMLWVQLQNTLKKQNGVHVVGGALVSDDGKVIYRGDDSGGPPGNTTEAWALRTWNDQNATPQQLNAARYVLSRPDVRPSVGPNGEPIMQYVPRELPPRPGEVPAQPTTALAQDGARPVPGTQQPARLTPAEMNMLDEQMNALGGARAAVPLLERALKLNDQAASGPLAVYEQHLNRVIDKGAATATADFNSIIGEQTLSQLKAIFGANPTEGERKILLEMQAAPTMTRAERQALLTRAIEAANRRITNAEGRVAEIKSGRFGRIDPGATAVPATPPASTPAVSAAAPQYSPEDLEYTARKHGITVDEVKRRLGVQ